jgi:FAD/FMN-containing dehydrogenase
MKVARLVFRCAKIVVLVGGAVLLLLLLSYGGLVAWVYLRDARTPLPPPEVGKSDFGRLNSSTKTEVIVPAFDTEQATKELQELVKRAAREGRKISIAGSQHSMGGHTLINDGLCVEMRCKAFQNIGPVNLHDKVATVRVGAGATWHELLLALDREGWSVGVMQSNDDFTVGGSLSVNCHGWNASDPPIDSTVEGFTLLQANGAVVECRRDRPEDRELFGATCGGYGLFGIILEVELRVVPNCLYKAEEFAATSRDYSTRFDSLVALHPEKIGLAYGRISTAPGPWFLSDARIIRFNKINDNACGVRNTIPENGGSSGITNIEIAIARAAFRASTGNNFGKLGRWSIERFHGQTHRVVSRNGILRTPSEWFANRDPHYIEILHEYFVPPDRLEDFLARIRPILRQNDEIDLLNVTVRKVQRDEISSLAYAREDVFGLVMLFRYRPTPEVDALMAKTTRGLIDVALDCRGSYYLPYRPHATLEQFRKAYPQCIEIYESKRKYDPSEVFQNFFYLNYVRPAGLTGK